MPNIMKKVPASYKPKGGGPKEYPAFLSMQEMQMLKAMTDGNSTRTKFGIPSFENLYGLANPSQTKSYYSAPTPTRNVGPTGGLGSNYSPSSAYTYSAPRASSSGGNTPFNGLGSNYSPSSGYTNTGGSNSQGNANNNSGQISSGGSNSQGNASNQSTQSKTSMLSSLSELPKSTLNGITSALGSILGFADKKPQGYMGPEAKWSIGNGTKQFYDRIPSSDVATASPRYSLPNIPQPQQMASNDWQIGGPQQVDYGKNLQIMRDRLAQSALPPIQSKASQLAGYDERIPQGDTSGNWTGATMPASWSAPKPPQVASNSGFMALPPEIPSFAKAGFDTSYLTGNKASSANQAQSNSNEGVIEDYRTAQSTPVRHAQAGGFGFQPYGQSHVQASAILPYQIATQVPDQSSGYPTGYSPNGPETPSNGIDAAPAGYTIASASDLGKGGGFIPSQAPFNQATYAEKYKQVTDANNASPQVRVANVLGHTGLGAGFLGAMRLADRATGGIYGNSTYTDGAANRMAGLNPMDNSFGKQPTTINIPSIDETSSSTDKTYSSKEDFAADHKGASAKDLEKLWKDYLKKHPLVTASSSKDWYYPTYTSGAWANLPKGKGNA